jgi:citronellol/citronellal dehydrogenase
MCKAALERFSTGLASEVYDDNVAVNALSPNRVVPTPGTVFHHLVSGDPNQVVEPPEVMAEAALALCSVAPHVAHRARRVQPGPVERVGDHRRRRWIVREVS